jgi:hypothetical protein
MPSNRENGSCPPGPSADVTCQGKSKPPTAKGTGRTSPKLEGPRDHARENRGGGSPGGRPEARDAPKAARGQLAQWTRLGIGRVGPALS